MGSGGDRRELMTFQQSAVALPGAAAPMAKFLTSVAARSRNSRLPVWGLAQTTPREVVTVAIGGLLLMVAEALASKPLILFGRYFWLDELWTRFIESKPGVWNSLVALKFSGDPTPPAYHLIARGFWGLTGGSPEVAFRALAFFAMWLALVLTYALLRRSFPILPALATVLALWSSPLIVQYAFFARPYALLLAATAGFSLIYTVDQRNWWTIALTALMAILVCTLHYFGIFALASIVLGDTLARRETIRDRIFRILPTGAGPAALILCLPLVREFNRGQTLFTFSPPLTFGVAAQSIGVLLGNSIVAAVVLLIAWGLCALMRRFLKRWWEIGEAIPIGSMPPLAGVMALMLVPFVLAVFSALTHPVLFPRYMITGMLGVVPILALIASRSSRAIVLAATLMMVLLSAREVRQFGVNQAKWQAAEKQMMEIGRNDNFPIVTFSFHEAYVLYAYAPALRPRLLIADLRAEKRPRLSKMMLHIAELMPKWSSVYPDLPRTVTLDGLRRMGKFHLVFSEAPVLTEQDAYPSRKFSLEEIANRVAMEKVGELYQVQSK